jgi:hypothetical protein
MEILGAEWGKDYRANHVFPVWFYGNDSKRDKKFVAVFPLWLYTASPSKMSLISPLLFSQYSRDHDSRWANLLLFSGWFSNKNERGDFLIPLWWRSTEKDRSRFYSIPYSVTTGPDAKSAAVWGPLYVSTRKGQSVSRWFLWPFAHFWKSGESRGSTVLPLYSWRQFAQGGWMFNSLPFNRRTGGEKELLNFGGSLYFSSCDDDSRYRAFLWPLYSESRSPSASWRVVFPLFGDFETSDSRTVVSPLFLRQRVADGSVHRFVSPLVSSGKERNREWTNVGVLLAHTSKGRNRSDYSFFADSLHVRRDKEDGASVSFGASLIKFLWADKYGFASPVIGHRNTLPGGGSVEAMREAVRADRETRVKSRHSLKRWTHIFMALNWGRRLAGTDGDVPVVRSHFMLFPLFSHYEYVGKSKRTHESNALFFLWNSRRETTGEAPRGAVETARYRLLRKAFDYERVGSRTSVDAFPFIAIDRNEANDSGRSSFLGPVVSRQRVGEKVRWRVLGVPWWGERIDPAE